MERKLATVLFVDLVSSTELLSGADPEVVRRRVTEFFDSVSSCVVSHGGIVEKFAGDAVMAAFGIPLAHEDDAERAVRAALAIRAKVLELGLAARIGIESGEVVADDSDSTFATGEAVNLAVRLQEAAGVNEILVGPGNERLTRGIVECEPVGPLELRGFPRPVTASRILAACDGGRALGSLSAPLVGREEELELLENTFARSARHGRASLFTVYGEPGVGKSRLAREFLAGLEGATILSGRCLPYGEGVTYWPLAEMVKASAGIADDDPIEEAKEKLRACCEDEAVADLLALAAGVLEAVEGERSPQEISWAARAWAEQLAQAQPLVLVFEDIHWGEEPLLDLVEHLAAWVKEAPLLLLCLARPELLDVRPTWGGGRVRATAIELEPLPPPESLELVSALVVERDAIVDVQAVLSKTEGNPLFVEEMIRMLLEHDDPAASERIPDTLQALIAARIDRLPPEQRAVLQRASVIGRIFWTGAIAHLSSDIEEPERALEQLLLRDLVVRESRSSISGEDAYKFKHVLIREVAYAGLAKSARAEHHERFAAWLGGHARDELLEIRAFHLDQAARLHRELDALIPPSLAAEAAEALTRAGRRALSRESFRSARRLLVRAVELEPTLARRYLAARAAWRLGDLATVAAEMETVRADAVAAGESRVEGRALTALADVVLMRAADAGAARALVEEALAALETRDAAGQKEIEARFEALSVCAAVFHWLGERAEVVRAASEALLLAQQAERKDLEAHATHALAKEYLLGLALDQAEPLLVRAVDLAEQGGSVVGRARALQARAWLDDLLGRTADSEAGYEASRSLWADLGHVAAEANAERYLGALVWRQGSAERGERLLRDAVRKLQGAGDRAHVCEAQRQLAQLLISQGELDEAERLALAARESVGPEDRYSLGTTQMALGTVRAAQGRDDEAEELLRGAVEGLRTWAFAVGELEALRELISFLRERDRGSDAVVYERRLGELVARSTAPIA